MVNDVNKHSASMYKFSYNEHAWMNEAYDNEFAVQEGMLAQAKKQVWVLEAESVKNPEYWCETESLAELEAAVREELVESCDFKLEVARIPFDKLQHKMQQEGLSFLGGSYQAFEGNHCDNEIYVLLRKA